MAIHIHEDINGSDRHQPVVLERKTISKTCQAVIMELTEKDLHCIARQLQSAWKAPEEEKIGSCRLLYGCWYCRYMHDCRTPETFHFRKVLDKLSRLTGVDVFNTSPFLWETFLPASVYLEHPEELCHMEECHSPDEYQGMKKYLEEIIGHPIEGSGLQQDSSCGEDSQT